MTEVQRRPIKCSLCCKTGHNVRSCQLFDTVKREAMVHYMTWIHQTICGFSNQWEDFAEDISTENLELLRNAESLRDILKEPLPWLKNIEDLALKSLTYGYKMNKKGTKQKKIELLHYMFIGEADKAWQSSLDIGKAVPYLIHSSNYIVELEFSNDQIFRFVDIMTEDFGFINNVTHDAFSRQERMRALYNVNSRMVRYFNQDLTRYDRQIRDTQRQLLRMQAEMGRLQNKKETLTQRRTIAMDELALFPPNLTKPQIEFIEKNIHHSIECAICYENIKAKNVTHLNCDHSFCIHCILNTVLTQYKSAEHRLECSCPICREKIKTISGNSEKLKERLQHQLHSHRINADLSDLIG